MCVLTALEIGLTGPSHAGLAFSSPACWFLGAKVAGELRFRQVNAAGRRHTCGVTVDDRAYCWGSNRDGQLGDGTVLRHWKPFAVAGGLRFRQVSARFDHTCGVTLGNVAYCWGLNTDGQLGDGTTTTSLVPVAVAAPAP